MVSDTVLDNKIGNIPEKELDEMDLLKFHPKYEAAESLLHDMLLKRMPPSSTIKILYPTSSRTATHHIQEFLDNPNIAPPAKGEDSIRHHDKKVVFEIRDIMTKLDDENDSSLPFSGLHNFIKMNLLDWKIPSIEVTSRYVGKHANYVLRSITAFQDARHRRDCKVPTTVHHHRVAGVSKAQGMGDDDVAAAYLHDTIENLIVEHILRNGFGGLEKFIDYYVPKELQPEVNLLTNYHDAILKHAKATLARDGGKLVTRDNLSYYLQAIEGVAPFLDRYVNNIMLRLNDPLMKSMPPSTEIYAPLKSACYNKGYILDLARVCKLNHNFRPGRKKIADLLDNREGIDSLDRDKKLQNAKKGIVIVNEFYGLHVDSKNPEGLDSLEFNRNVAELGESILSFVEFFVIRDILAARYKQDFVASAAIKIDELQGVLYTDRASKL